jgi:glutaredoxin 3
MALAKRITVYTTPVCPHCDRAKRRLAELGVTFREVDIMSDRAGLREMLVMTGRHAVPVVVVGEKAMVGWDAREFQRLSSIPARA